MFQQNMSVPRGLSDAEWHPFKMVASQALPVLAAKLLDPAAGHKLVAAQEALLFFRE
jgi:hypothetical protein